MSKVVPSASYFGETVGDRKRALLSSRASIQNCPKCTCDHVLAECPEYLKLSLNGRWESVKSARICFICLRMGHRRIECKESLCNVCSGPHHTTLHNFYARKAEDTPPLSTSGTVLPNYTKGVPTISRSLLSIVHVTLVKDELKRKLNTLLLVNDGQR